MQSAVPSVTALPPVVTIEEAQRFFKIGKTNLYALAAAGEIESLTLGGPGSRGRRAFMTESLLRYINRRVEVSPKLTTTRKLSAKAAKA